MCWFGEGFIFLGRALDKGLGRGIMLNAAGGVKHLVISVQPPVGNPRGLLGKKVENLRLNADFGVDASGEARYYGGSSLRGWFKPERNVL